jgi:hypothetical protein
MNAPADGVIKEPLTARAPTMPMLLGRPNGRTPPSSRFYGAEDATAGQQPGLMPGTL